jgi:hypothetical protein
MAMVAVLSSQSNRNGLPARQFGQYCLTRYGATDMKRSTLPNCLQCKNYFITYEPARPHGCRAMGFKSKITPARVVLQTSSLICQLYAPQKKHV